MSNMKCPICKQELECCETYMDGTKKLWCDNCGLFGDNRLFEELIRTRKALDIAVKRLGYIKNNYKSWIPDRDEQMIAQAANGLDEIKTALEQKDK